MSNHLATVTIIAGGRYTLCDRIKQTLPDRPVSREEAERIARQHGLSGNRVKEFIQWLSMSGE